MEAEVKRKSSHALSRLGPKRLKNRLKKLNIRSHRVQYMFQPLMELNVLDETAFLKLFNSYKAISYEIEKATYFLHFHGKKGSCKELKDLTEDELIGAFFDNRSAQKHWLTKKYYNYKGDFINDK